ncbi:MAG: hypothetical protein U9R25_19620 [Chloroflexota bacterium]|nr:hypothetical protein [Chloroflexota bacterium]
MRQRTRGHGEGATRGFSSHPRVAASSASAVNIKLSFPGSNPNARIETLDPLDTVVSYFFGNDPDKWQPDVPVWGGVRYVDLYPGIDLELSSGKGQWDWQLIAKTPTPSSSQGEGRGGGGSVRLQVEGAAVTGVEQGDLLLAFPTGTVALALPQADFIYRIEGETGQWTSGQLDRNAGGTCFAPLANACRRSLGPAFQHLPGRQ